MDRRTEPADLDAASALWGRLAAGDESVWAHFDAVEARAAAASAEERTAYALGYFETLLNQISHPGSAVDAAAFRARLGPALRRLADELEAYWTLVADWVDEAGPAPTRLPAEAVYAIRDATLAKLAWGMHRTLRDGRFVALSDVVRRELATGETFAAS